MDILVVKIIAMVLMGTLALFFGLLPLKVKKIILKGGENARKRRKRERILSGFLCFGAGVLLATVFVHMIPETREGFERVKRIQALNSSHSGVRSGRHYHHDHAHSENVSDPENQEKSRFSMLSHHGHDHEHGNLAEESSNSHGHHDGHDHHKHNHDHTEHSHDGHNHDHHEHNHTEHSHDGHNHDHHEHNHTEHSHEGHGHVHHDNENYKNLEDNKSKSLSNMENKMNKTIDNEMDDVHNTAPHIELVSSDHVTDSADQKQNKNDESNITETKVANSTVDQESVHNHADNHKHDHHDHGHHHDHSHDHDHGHHHDHSHNHDHGHHLDHSHDHDHNHDHTHGDNVNSHDHGHHKDHSHDHNHNHDHTHDDNVTNHDHEHHHDLESTHGSIGIHQDNEVVEFATIQSTISISDMTDKMDPTEISLNEEVSTTAIELEGETITNLSISETITEASDLIDNESSFKNETKDENRIQKRSINDEESPRSEPLTKEDINIQKNASSTDSIDSHSHSHSNDEHDHGYPLAELVVCLGFFLIYLIEEIMHKIFFKKSEKDGYDEAGLWTNTGHDTAGKDVEGFSQHNLCHHGNHIPPIHTSSAHDHFHKKGNGKKSGSGNKDLPILKSMTPRDEWGVQGVDNPVFAGDIDATTWNPKIKESLVANNQVHPGAVAETRRTHFDSTNAAPGLDVPDGMKDVSLKKNSTALVNLRSLLIVVALSFHAVFEGMAIGLQQIEKDVWYLFFAISAHKYVICFCIGLELAMVGTPLALFILYVLILALVTPFGVGIGIIITEYGDTGGSDHNLIITILQGLAGGTILYVAIIEVLERERSKRGGRLTKLFCLLLGFALMAALEAVGGHSHGQLTPQ